MDQHFDPACAASWLSRGREPEVALALARIWRELPDLPSDAPKAAIMERIRMRAEAMRAINDAVQERTERDRRVRNFAFTEGKAASGTSDARDLAILRARDAHGLDWNEAVRYAEGWYAAHAGLAYRERFTGSREPARERAAYDLGFQDGGGDRSDLFDAARRAYLAAAPVNRPPAPSLAAGARPMPSSWAKPTDAPRPARWSRRLAILTEADMRHRGTEGGTGFASMMIRPEMAGLLIVVIRGSGFTTATKALSESSPPCDGKSAAEQLQALVAGADIEDILTTAEGAALALLDAVAHVLPLARNCERAQNSALQRRSHIRTWLDRGLADGQSVGAGHIRWGKAAQGLRASLGEFAAVDRGCHARGAHELHVVLADGSLANGFVDAAGVPLDPRIRFTSRARLRPEMARALRAFGGATRLTQATKRGEGKAACAGEVQREMECML